MGGDEPRAQGKGRHGPERARIGHELGDGARARAGGTPSQAGIQAEIGIHLAQQPGKARKRIAAVPELAGEQYGAILPHGDQLHR